MTRKDLLLQKLSKFQALVKNKSHLLIVSKTRPLEDIELYYSLGHRDFGENRVQELSEKALALQDKCPDIRWHMIGHLQSNKVNSLLKVKNLYAIHSVHDEGLLSVLIKTEAKLDHEVRVFLQVNTSHEEEKSGFESFEELRPMAQKLLSAKKLKLAGLMTMGTLRTSDFEGEARRCFKDLNSLRERLGQEVGVALETSMGMSQDYLIALEEKSDWIRVGTVMFV